MERNGMECLCVYIIYICIYIYIHICMYGHRADFACRQDLKADREVVKAAAGQSKRALMPGTRDCLGIPCDGWMDPHYKHPQVSLAESHCI